MNTLFAIVAIHLTQGTNYAQIAVNMNEFPKLYIATNVVDIGGSNSRYVAIGLK